MPAWHGGAGPTKLKLKAPCMDDADYSSPCPCGPRGALAAPAAAAWRGGPLGDSLQRWGDFQASGTAGCICVHVTTTLVAAISPPLRRRRRHSRRSHCLQGAAADATCWCWLPARSSTKSWWWEQGQLASQPPTLRLCRAHRSVACIAAERMRARAAQCPLHVTCMSLLLKQRWYFSAQLHTQVKVLEKTDEAGKKVRISGGTRCNVLPSTVELPRDYFTDSSTSALRAVFRWASQGVYGVGAPFWAAEAFMLGIHARCRLCSLLLA